MSTENKKLLFEPEIPEPTDEDLKWAKKFDKKGLGWFEERKLRKMVDGNQLWRMKHFCKQNVGDGALSLSFRIPVDNYANRYLIGRAATANLPDMTLLLAQHGAKAANFEQNKTWTFGVFGNRCPKILYAMTLHEENIEKRFKETLAVSGFYEGKCVFIEADLIACDNEALLLAIKSNDLKFIKYLVERGTDIYEHNSLAIKVAEGKGNIEAIHYLKGKAGLLDEEPLALPAPVQESGSDKYQKLSDVELLKTSISDDGSMTLTTVFNFEMEDVVRTQYMKDRAPSETHRNFDDFKDKTYLKVMFDELVSLGGQPSSDTLKSVKKIRFANNNDHQKVVKKCQK